jgi:hypothetical protein
MVSRDADARRAKAIVEQAISHAVTVFGRRLRCGAVIGSLTHGGFSAIASDIDVALVLADADARDPLSVSAVSASVQESGCEFSDRLSIFWGTVEQVNGDVRGGRFRPQIDSTSSTPVVSSWVPTSAPRSAVRLVLNWLLPPRSSPSSSSLRAIAVQRLPNRASRSLRAPVPRRRWFSFRSGSSTQQLPASSAAMMMPLPGTSGMGSLLPTSSERPTAGGSPGRTTTALPRVSSLNVSRSYTPISLTTTRGDCVHWAVPTS